MGRMKKDIIKTIAGTAALGLGVFFYGSGMCGLGNCIGHSEEAQGIPYEVEDETEESDD
ncbi:MAG: hypothetical protein HUJ63_09245 [Enterococcus sp.]|nr:hypothetical protein [Enterococcus sp.]